MIKNMLFFLSFIFFSTISFARETPLALDGKWYRLDYEQGGERSPLTSDDVAYSRVTIDLKIDWEGVVNGGICYVTGKEDESGCVIDFKSILKNDEIVVHAKNTWDGILEGKIRIEDCGNILHWELKKLSGKGYALTEGYLYKRDIRKNDICRASFRYLNRRRESK